MWRLLEKIRAKPVHVRKRILFIATTFLTLLVFVVWASTFVSGISQMAASGDTEDVGQNSFSFLHFFQNAFVDIFKTADKNTKVLKTPFTNSANVYIREEPAKQ